MWRFAGHLSRLSVYGWWDTGLSDSELDDLAQSGDRLSLHSYRLVEYARAKLEEHGIQTRHCGTATTNEWHDYYRWDNLRSLCEVYDAAERGRVLFDVEMGCRFKDGGRLLDLYEVCALYRAGQTPELDFISWRMAVDTRERYSNWYTFYTYIMEALGQSDPALHTWFRRMYQVPYQQVNDDRYCGVQSDAEFTLMQELLVSNYTHRVDWTDWRETYYESGALQVTNLPVSGLTASNATLNGQVVLVDHAQDAVYLCWGDEDGGILSTSDWDHVVYMGTNWYADDTFATNVAFAPGGIIWFGSIPSDATAVFWVDTDGTLSAYNDDAVVDTGVAVDTGKWSRVRVCGDYSSKEWSLWIDESKAIADYGFYADTLNAFTGVTFVVTKNASMYLDHIRIWAQAPSFFYPGTFFAIQ